jgi:hypothetical protein
VAVLVRPCAVAARRHSEAVFISEQKLSRLLRTRTEKVPYFDKLNCIISGSSLMKMNAGRLGKESGRLIG